MMQSGCYLNKDMDYVFTQLQTNTYTSKSYTRILQVILAECPCVATDKYCRLREKRVLLQQYTSMWTW
jgi:hypothetical protein